MRLLWEWWIQIWPNLAASAVVWLPTFTWHHRRMKAHVDAAIRRQAEAGPGQVTASVKGSDIDKNLIRFMRQAGPRSKS